MNHKKVSSAKSRPQKLVLNRETIRRLTSDELSRVAAGRANDGDTDDLCSISGDRGCGKSHQTNIKCG